MKVHVRGLLLAVMFLFIACLTSLSLGVGPLEPV